MEQKVLQIVSEALGVSATEETKLDDLESLEFIELIRELEIEFDIRIEDQDILGVNTAGDAVRLVAKKKE